MTDSTPTQAQRDELHSTDAATRAAWTAFEAAYRARAAASFQLRIYDDQITLDNTWNGEAVLSGLRQAVDRLRTGERLDVAIGDAVLERQAAETHAARRAAEQEASLMRQRAAEAALLARLNRGRADDELAARALRVEAMEAALAGEPVTPLHRRATGLTPGADVVLVDAD